MTEATKLPRPSSDDERLELKAATRRALHLAGKANAFAMITRVEPPVLSKYGSPAETSAFMPIDVALDLDREIGAPMIVEVLAEMLGYRLVPIGSDGGDEGKVDLSDVAAISREGNDVVQSVLAAKADGNIDAAEKRVIREQIGENIVALRALDRKLGAK